MAFSGADATERFPFRDNVSWIMSGRDLTPRCNALFLVCTLVT